jgi:hypothetical protein
LMRFRPCAKTLRLGSNMAGSTGLGSFGEKARDHR